jgi:hypothetical protein
MSIQSSVVGSLGAIADTAKGISDIKASQENQSKEIQKEAIDVLNKDANFTEKNIWKLQDKVKGLETNTNEKSILSYEDVEKNLPDELKAELKKELEDKHTKAQSALLSQLMLRQQGKEELDFLKERANKLRWAKRETFKDTKQAINNRLEALKENRSSMNKLWSDLGYPGEVPFNEKTTKRK